jgi:very-short-patch-repair endonuclease
MNCKLTPPVLDHAIELMRKHTLTETARMIGVSADRLSKVLRARGIQTRGVVYRPAPNACDYPRQMVAKLHARGWSVKKMAERFGVTRATIRAQLLRDGIEPRDRSAAMLQRMSRTTKKERKRLASAAHQAARGRVQTLEEKIKRARTGGQRVGPGEHVLAKCFSDLRIEFETQKPIHIYNVDFVIDGRIAVEPSAKGTTSLHYPEWRERTKCLIERGYSVLAIRYKRLSALRGCLDQIVTDLNSMRCNPATICEYRVVQCGSEDTTLVRREDGTFAAVETPVRFRYRRIRCDLY